MADELQPRPTLDVLIVRDPRESAKKCSLTPLRGMEGIRFATYAHDRRVAAGKRMLLHTEGELISTRDAGGRAQIGLAAHIVGCAFKADRAACVKGSQRRSSRVGSRRCTRC